MMIRSFIIGIFLLGTTLFSSTIKVAVAANVSYAIKDIVKEFSKKYPDIKVQVILGSSGKLTAQIKYGAPYDIFMSANMKYPQTLYADNIAITKPFIYAQGRLAYISTHGLKISQNFHSFVTNPKIKKIAIANPKTAPYGIATKEALLNSNLYSSLQKKYIYGESISQTLSYALRAADMGFVAKSALFSPKMAHYKEGKDWQELDSSLYTPINQGIVILKYARDKEDVVKFYNFILGKESQKILQKFGYAIP